MFLSFGQYRSPIYKQYIQKCVRNFQTHSCLHQGKLLVILQNSTTRISMKKLPIIQLNSSNEVIKHRPSQNSNSQAPKLSIFDLISKLHKLPKLVTNKFIYLENSTIDPVFIHTPTDTM